MPLIYNGYKKISRKRFVKKCMANGIPRNKAEGLAKGWRRQTGSMPYWAHPAPFIIFEREERYMKTAK